MSSSSGSANSLPAPSISGRVNCPFPPERGNIFDANGELLAGNTAAYTLYARANAVRDAEKTARALSLPSAALL